MASIISCIFFSLSLSVDIPLIPFALSLWFQVYHLWHNLIDVNGGESRQIAMSDSIDLLKAVIAHREFLMRVDKYPCLYGGPHAQNALRRYERNEVIV